MFYFKMDLKLDEGEFIYIVDKDLIKEPIYSEGLNEIYFKCNMDLSNVGAQIITEEDYLVFKDLRETEIKDSTALPLAPTETELLEQRIKATEDALLQMMMEGML
ncbi:hypothetical protein QUF56_09400 [Ureibacillus composti]|nr:hypothetical protein [Ureibacillus composti]